MTKADITISATDKLIGAAMFQTALLEKINEEEGISAKAKAIMLSAMAKAASTCQFRIDDREKQLMKQYFEAEKEHFVNNS